ncbi:hypothetical protein GCM10023084_78970 [Streptomyces lacrimifluminis]|uniref:Uncharacterized protein n=1 Tax=Streptomyces lacrimifluminis TaxID=1500077 RepID=A0A917UMK0_9ACTN|nr:hypothetical protein GCM10012282_77320 [Streptomyces lacrimifluminis]
MVADWAFAAGPDAAKPVPEVARPPAASPITAVVLTSALAKTFDRIRRLPLGSLGAPAPVAVQVARREWVAEGEGRHGCRTSDVLTGRFPR